MIVERVVPNLVVSDLPQAVHDHASAPGDQVIGGSRDNQIRISLLERPEHDPSMAQARHRIRQRHTVSNRRSAGDGSRGIHLRASRSCDLQRGDLRDLGAQCSAFEPQFVV